MQNNQWQLIQIGENALMLVLEPPLREKSTQFMRDLSGFIEKQYPIWLENYTPAFHQCLFQFDMWQIDHIQAKHLLNNIVRQVCDITPTTASKINQNPDFVMPVFYDPCPSQTDLIEVSKQLDKDIAHIVKLHSDALYEVQAIGFLPQFAYLSGLHEALRLPRLSQPKARIAAYSLAIAAEQTAIYPQDSPGGWHVIGRAVCNFNELNQQAINVGQRVKFLPVNETEYRQLVQDYQQKSRATYAD